MAIIKSYTDLEQSRKLAEILPLKSADMYYSHEFVNSAGDYYKLNIASEGYFDDEESLGSDIPAWSLAALLDIVKTYSSRLEIALRADKNYNIFAVSGDFVFRSFDECSEGYDNPVDACYDVVLKLHEINLL